MSHDAALPFDQQLDVRRRAAMRKLEFARSVMRQADQWRRQTEQELQEIEIAERVFRGLPATASEAMALEQSVSPDQLWNEVQVAAHEEIAQMERSAERRAERNRIAHGDIKAENVLSTTSLREVVGDVCVHLLQDGSWKTTEELHSQLQHYNIPLERVQNPVQRVSQILSMDPRFRNQRGRGWSLASAAERDDWEENVRRNARMALDKDNSAR